MKIADREIMRTPTIGEERLIAILKAKLIGAAFVCLSGAIVFLVASIALPIIAIVTGLIQLNVISITISAICALFFGACLVAAINDYVKSKLMKRGKLEQFAVIDCTLNSIETKSYVNKVCGSINAKTEQNVVLKFEHVPIKDLFENKVFMLFTYEDELLNAVGVSGKLILANSVVLEDIEPREND